MEHSYYYLYEQMMIRRDTMILGITAISALGLFLIYVAGEYGQRQQRFLMKLTLGVWYATLCMAAIAAVL